MLALVLAAPAAAVTTAEGWKELAPEDDSFRVRFPADPELTESSRWTPIGRIASRGYRLYRERDGCDVVAADLPALVRAMSGPETLYRMGRDNLLAEADGRQTRYEDWERGGVPGKLLEWSSERAFGRAEFYRLGTRLYVFSCFVRGTAPTGIMRGFFERLSVWEP